MLAGNIFTAQMMEAVRISERSVCFNQITQHYIPESCVIFNNC
jgi:hypothetical protein